MPSWLPPLLSALPGAVLAWLAKRMIDKFDSLEKVALELSKEMGILRLTIQTETERRQELGERVKRIENQTLWYANGAHG